jgi:hypothetical protein
MNDGRDHVIPILLVNRGHETAVNERQLGSAVGGGIAGYEQVAWMWIGVEKARVKQLRQKGFLRGGRHIRNRFDGTVAQLCSINPFTHQNAPRTEFFVDSRDNDGCNVLVQQ